MSVFVTAAAGTEPALRDELRELGLRRVRADRGGVQLPGGREEAAIVCLRSRIAVRVLVEVGRFPCPNEDALYDGASAIAWQRWLTPERTLAVSAVARDSVLTHTNYIAQLTKDAIVDVQRRRERRRSNVERHDPDLGVFVHLRKNEAALFLDASGGSLHQRGWRARGGAAPLKETLAAALLRIAGWDRTSPLCDPMCGSGTLPIEADLWARSVPTQRPDRRFGFERWADFDDPAAAALRALRVEGVREARSEGPACLGLDRDPTAIELARANAGRARSRARFEESDLSAFSPPDGAFVIANPPYGERLSVDANAWRELGRTIDRLAGHRIAVLVPETDGPKLSDRRPESVHHLWNGRLRCRLVTWGAA